MHDKGTATSLLTDTGRPLEELGHGCRLVIRLTAVALVTQELIGPVLGVYYPVKDMTCFIRV